MPEIFNMKSMSTYCDKYKKWRDWNVLKFNLAFSTSKNFLDFFKTCFWALLSLQF
jgi:hypothetical protein